MLFQYVTKLSEVYCTKLKIDSESNLSATDILKASSLRKGKLIRNTKQDTRK